MNMQNIIYSLKRIRRESEKVSDSYRNNKIDFEAASIKLKNLSVNKKLLIILGLIEGMRDNTLEHYETERLTDIADSIAEITANHNPDAVRTLLEAAGYETQADTIMNELQERIEEAKGSSGHDKGHACRH